MKSSHATTIGTHFDTMSRSLSRLVPLVNKRNSTLPNPRDYSNQFPLHLVHGKKSPRTSSSNSPSLMGSTPFWSLLITSRSMLTSYRLTQNYRQKDVRSYSKTMSGRIMVCQRSSPIEDLNSQHISRLP